MYKIPQNVIFNLDLFWIINTFIQFKFYFSIYFQKITNRQINNTFQNNQYNTWITTLNLSTDLHKHDNKATLNNSEMIPPRRIKIY